MLDECGVDAKGVANPEGFEAGFEGATDEDGGEVALRCEDGEELGLDLGERRHGHGEECFGDACSLTIWMVGSNHTGEVLPG